MIYVTSLVKYVFFRSIKMSKVIDWLVVGRQNSDIYLNSYGFQDANNMIQTNN